MSTHNFIQHGLLACIPRCHEHAQLQTRTRCAHAAHTAEVTRCDLWDGAMRHRLQESAEKLIDSRIESPGRCAVAHRFLSQVERLNGLRFAASHHRRSHEKMRRAKNQNDVCYLSGSIWNRRGLCARRATHTSILMYPVRSLPSTTPRWELSICLQMPTATPRGRRRAAQPPTRAALRSSAPRRRPPPPRPLLAHPHPQPVQR